MIREQFRQVKENKVIEAQNRMAIKRAKLLLNSIQERLVAGEIDIKGLDPKDAIKEVARTNVERRALEIHITNILNQLSVIDEDL